MSYHCLNCGSILMPADNGGYYCHTCHRGFDSLTLDGNLSRIKKTAAARSDGRASAELENEEASLRRSLWEATHARRAFML